MMQERIEQALWLEWSGLPAALNKVRTGAWPVFKKLVELDCQAHRSPETVELSVCELAERTGYEPETALKIIEALRKRKYLRCYLPENPEEAALFEIRTPIQTPLAAAAVAERVNDPLLRDVSTYRYLAADSEAPLDEKKVQEIVDLYFNLVSHKMNSFIIDQIEIVARRFDLEAIRLAMERAARHELRSMSWVLKELIRDHSKLVHDPINNRF